MSRRHERITRYSWLGQLLLSYYERLVELLQVDFGPIHPLLVACFNDHLQNWVGDPVKKASRL